MRVSIDEPGDQNSPLTFDNFVLSDCGYLSDFVDPSIVYPNRCVS